MRAITDEAAAVTEEFCGAEPVWQRFPPLVGQHQLATSCR